MAIKFQTFYAWLERRDGRKLPNASCGPCTIFASEYDIAEGYGEPGYTDPKAGVLIGDWNAIPSEVCRVLERSGFELEWSDEWTIHYEGDGKAYRVSADSYGWQPSLIFSEGGDMWSAADAEADPDGFLEACGYIDNPGKAVPTNMLSQDQLRAIGFRPVETDLQNGWYHGQTDDPMTIFNALSEYGWREVIFYLDGVGQFDVHFSAWVREDSDAHVVDAHLNALETFG